MKSGTGFMGRQELSAQLWIASRMLLAGHQEEFFERWEKTSRSLEADDIHDLRVASRRLREGLALFSPCFPGDDAAQVNRELKKVTRMLGNQRNTDEACLFFSSLPQPERARCREQVEELSTSLRQEREQAHKDLKRKLRALDPDPLSAGLDAMRGAQNLFGDSDPDPFLQIVFFARGALTERAQPLVQLLGIQCRFEVYFQQHLFCRHLLA